MGLATLSGVEMWERFSYYGLQAILVYYLYYAVSEGGLGIDQSVAVSIMGAYGGLVYLTSVFGAWVADRILSAERTLFYAAILVMFGHISLAIVPGVVGVTIGLIAVAVGSGTVKTTSQVILGSLYSRGDQRRDGGFSIYYMGVNLGALIGPLICNALWGWQGFHWGFGAAAVMMAIGLIQYSVSRRRTIGTTDQSVTNPLPTNHYLPIFGIGTVVVIAVVLLFATGILAVGRLSDFAALVALVTAVIMWVQMYRSPLVSPEERSRLVGFIPMFLASVLFWSMFQQQSSVIAVYSDERLNRTILGVELSPGFVQSINPLMIIIFAGVFGAIWTRLGDRQPSYATKFGVSIVIIGLSMLGFVPFAGGEANSTPLLALVGILFLFTIAELLLSPVGNSLATRLAPQAFPTRMFALWMLSVSLGTALSGTLASQYDPSDASGERTYFLTLFGVSVVLSALLLLARRWISRKIATIDE